VPTLDAEFLAGEALYRRVVLDKLSHARESVWISTANVKAMLVEHQGRFAPVADLFARLARAGVEIRLLHAELPSRPFRAAFDKQSILVRGGMTLKICPRVHFKCVLIDGAWLYLGSANLTGAGLGAKHADARNFEVGFCTEDFETIDQTAALFERIWSGKSCATCRLHDVCPDPIGAGPPATRRRRKGGGDIQLGRARRLR
jgi:phosphatidylserine/phosphatidylglycerophosphate/cardiolipin synthase-like enzyme